MYLVHHFHIQLMIIGHYLELLWFFIIIMAIFLLLDMVLGSSCILTWIYVVFVVIIDGFEVSNSFGALK